MSRNLVAGFVFIALGTAALLYGQRYPMGTVGDMGAGYFPNVLSAIMVFFGGATIVEALVVKNGAPIPAAAGRPLVAITASVLAFALLLERAGLPLAVFVSSMVASAARPRFFTLMNLILAAGLAVASVIIFVNLLAIPMRVLPAAIQGY